MDVRKIAAEKKAKALADLKEAEEMEQTAAQLEQMAAKHGWSIEINADGDADTKKPSVAATTRKPLPILPKPGRGKLPDPNSMTSRSKTESIAIIRQLNRPVPLGELLEKISKIGVHLGGKMPNQALSANLGRCPELRPTPRGWWLRGVAIPPETKSQSVGKQPDMLKELN